MYAQERHRQILDLLATEGRVSAADLAEQFAVTTETIRRDLDALAADALLTRVHGGAVARRTETLEPDLASRQTTNTAIKRRIARAAAALLPADPATSVLLDAGTTTAELVHHLAERTGPLLTNAPSIASAILTHSDLEVHILPGRLRGTTHAAVGALTVESLRRLRPGIAFLGCNGMTAEGFTTPDPEEATVKRTMVEQADLRVVLADSSKADARHLVTFAEPADIDVLVTDSGLSPALAEHFTEQGVEVIRA